MDSKSLPFDSMLNVIEGYKALCAYVAAIPTEVQLPAMPGIDRDFYDALVDKAEVELTKLREQKPVAWMHDKAGRVDTCHASVKELWIKVGQKQNTQFMREIVPCRVEHYNIPLYAVPVPVPAPATECRGIPGRGCQYLAACNMPCNKCGKVHNAMFSLTPTPFIPDDDTRRNDEAFAAQQAATAPIVPDGCAIVSRTLTPEAWKRLCNADIWPVTPKSFQRMLDVLMEVALLKSTNHSNEVKS